MKNKLNILFLVFTLFIVSGCAELIDCIASTKPVITTDNLPNASYGFNYNATIVSEVKNTSYDDSFYYYYSIEGNLPSGISYNVAGRELVFTGTPTVPGNYTFKVNLKIEAPENNFDNDNDGFFEDDNRICFGDDTTQKTFTITVL
jgi:Putative Ig domain